MSRLIFVCRTCDRNTRLAPGERAVGARLAGRIRGHILRGDDRGWTVREVACLSGCLHPCNVSFRAQGRFSYRFGRIEVADVDAILAFGRQYWTTKEGAVGADRIDGALRAKMTVCTPPPGRWQ